MDQLILELIVKLPVLFADAPTVKLDLLTLKYGSAPSCVTLTVFELTPDALIVTVADRELRDVFSLAETVIVRLLEPLDGLTESQLLSSLIVQLVFELIVKLPELFADAPTVKLDLLIVRYGSAPSCVTVTVLELTPVPLIVTVAERELVDVFSLAVTVAVPSAEPLVGFTVSQSASSLIIQLVLELIEKCSWLLSDELRLKLVGLTLRYKLTTVTAAVACLPI